MKKNKHTFAKRTVIAATACLTGLITVNAAESLFSTHRATYLKIEDSQANAFEFFGTWRSNTDTNDCSGGSQHYTNKTVFGNEDVVGYSVKFTGTEISIYGNKAPLLGISQVYIDDEYVDEFSANNDTRITQQFLFKVDKLSNQEHTLRVVNKKEGSPEQGMHVDYVLVRQEDSTEAYETELTIEDSTSTETQGEENKICYFGTWNGSTYLESCSGGSQHYSNSDLSPGNESVGYTLSFTGTGVSLYGNKAPALGESEVFIDDVSQGTYSATNTDGRISKQLLFTVNGLPDQKHTLRVVNKKTGGSLKGIHLDYIVIKQQSSGIETATVNPQSLTLAINEDKTITVSDTEGALLWEVEDSSVASVSNGTVSGHSEGTTFVIITAEDTGIVYRIPVTVTSGTR